MPWIYEQATGKVRHNEEPVLATGYSGAPPYVNAPGAEAMHDYGPIPRGKWMIGEEFTSESCGPVCLRLLPGPGTDTYGRSGFLVHGDSLAQPGHASRGCIILPRAVRLQMAASDDKILVVV